MILEQDKIEKILDYAMSHGGDFAEVYVEEVRRSRGWMLGEKMADMSAGYEKGIGIRVFSGESSYYCSSETFDEGVLLSQMQILLKEKQQHPERADLSRLRRYQVAGKEADFKEQARLLENCNTAGKRVSDKISQMSSILQNMDQKVMIANSEGLLAEDRRRKTRLLIKAYAKDGEEVVSSYVGPGAFAGFEFYDHFSVEEYAKNVAREAVSLLGGVSCPTGRMPVVIANGFGGLFFHEACGHSLEASAATEGCSEFSGKIGKQVASEKVTLIDDGSISGEWGSARMDDEGIPTQKNVLIERGVLGGYLVDRWNARKLNCKATGSGRRENYRFAPVSRMTNTYIAPGEDRLEEMIGEVEQGLYVSAIHAGSVNPVTGEFNFNTSAAYLIEDGKISTPVKNATLVGRGGDILKKVDAVAGDFKMGQGFCYAGSGALFVGVGQPSVRISELTVGGCTI